MADAVLAGGNQYPPAHGFPALREAVAAHQRRRYGLDYTPQGEVLVTTGATEALAAALLALCDPGDEVIAFDPCYDAYPAGARLAGAHLVPVPLAEDTTGRRRASCWTPTRAVGGDPAHAAAAPPNTPGGCHGTAGARARGHADRSASASSTKPVARPWCPRPAARAPGGRPPGAPRRDRRRSTGRRR
ncbi:aminotransferase class I/II-fold pyridoxal phosphate-dependent enzyme [Streptomyces cinnamoneus]|uniref:aminotransferase class I/II-fold pyridoxal phosphate-dependent enzyme n=1 Tax=Streptomyces cinnamoneus TaxID=53446 RepID=UPI001EFDCA63|nr:aminotransferase class I/II-fold pyridoxal phosphate-dependent enzyme [Streptomyces cinnamoneus]